MSKRPAAEARPAASGPEKHERDCKRQKTEHRSKPAQRLPLNTAEIHTSRQLEQLLAFQQGDIAQLKSGLHAFKIFLESILYPTDEAVTPRHRAILREYLQSQRPRNLQEKDRIFVPEIFQTWTYAGETNNEDLLLSTVANLALLLKTLSHHLEFRDDGLGICRTLLQRPYLKLLSRALSAEKHKERVISPALRVLTEVVSFDGGALARQVYSKRDFTFDTKTMARNLSISRAVEGPDGKRKPSIRSNCVRYLLAHLKYQEDGARIDILKHGNIFRALFDHIKEDPLSLASEILDVIKNRVVMDASIPRASKSILLTERALSNIVRFYRVSQEEEEPSNQKQTIDRQAHEFLLLVCTNPEMGLLSAHSGWCPPSADPEPNFDELTYTDRPAIYLGLDSIEWGNLDFGGVQMRNTVLSEFIRKLRPYSNTLEQDLLLAVFRASPELLAEYFRNISSFPFEPKLTATWIGYSSFIFSTIQLPIPPFLGNKHSFRDVPPPVWLAIESVLPLPLTQKALTKCLCMIQTSELISFFAVRILIVAFQKIQDVLKMFRQAGADHPSIWEQASKRLIAEFCQRCPKMKDVVETYRRTGTTKHFQREAITRLLAMYYTIIPQSALDVNFDVAVPLTSSLVALDSDTRPDEDRPLQLLELNHLLRIAQISPSMSWWHKPERLRFSPFTTLLRLVTLEKSEISSAQVKSLLTAIVRNHGLLQLRTSPTSLDGLITSLKQIHGSLDAVFAFLDECLRRVVSKTVKYQDDLDATIPSECSGPDAVSLPVSLLLMALKEQWEYRCKNSSHHENLVSISAWLETLLATLQDVGENGEVLSRVMKDMNESCGKVTNLAIAINPRKHIESLSTWRLDGTSSVVANPNHPYHAKHDKHDQPVGRSADPSLRISLELPPKEDEIYPGLNRWMRREAEEVVEEGDAGELIICLCSRHLSIRREALGNLRKLLKKIELSKYSEWQQINLLLSEVIETARPSIDDHPFPYVGGVLAKHCMNVLVDPSHFMYPKVNKFLNRGPSWRVEKLPSYWADKILLNPPSEDNAYNNEIEWLLDYFMECLRTPEDMNIFRASNVFERLLALYDYRFVPFRVKEKVVRLLFRAAAVNGSTSLITRVGVLAWIGAHWEAGNRHAGWFRQLAERLYDTCDKTHVKEWSGGAVEKLVESIVRQK